MDSEDGLIFVKNLAHFVHTHERALANALQAQLQPPHRHALNPPSTATSHSKHKTAAITLAEALSRPYLFFSSPSLKAAKLSLTPHHLYYLLSKFEDLGVDVGPTKVRLEDLHSNASPSEYMSFLSHPPKSRGKQSDADSLKSVSSVRSVMSTMSSFLSNLSLSSTEAKAEKQLAQFKDNVRYLYSCFTKIPALRLAPDHKVRPIAGYEAFPFDTAVPLHTFKNVSALEICDIDFRQFFGWHWIAQNLHSLVVKRACVNEPRDLLEKIIMDDMKGRREHASQTKVPTTPSATRASFWPTNSPKARHGQSSRFTTSMESPLSGARRASLGSPYTIARDGSSDGSIKRRKRSNSPGRPTTSRHDSLHKPHLSGTSLYPQSINSSESSVNEVTPRHSALDLLLSIGPPKDTWRCLRHLSLAENGFTSLKPDDLSSVSGTLQSLDLSGNHFSEIPDLSNLTHLRALNLSHCMIDSLKSLLRIPVPAITTLNLRSNRLLQLVGIERVPSLERVDLRDNRLHDPVELARLAQCPNIIDLYVIRNPFTRTHGEYRVTIFNEFRKNPHLSDDIAIDSLGPVHHEKKHLNDRAQEPLNVLVTHASFDHNRDDGLSATSNTGLKHTTITPLVVETRTQPARRQPHRRTTSDAGPRSLPRQERPRRRVVELAGVDALSNVPPESFVGHTDRHLHTPSETDEPTTPDHTDLSPPIGSLPNDAAQDASRPSLQMAFTTPPPAPRICDSSDEESLPVRAPSDQKSATTIYRQNIEHLKRELGSDWLSALTEDRFIEARRDRSLHPSLPPPFIGIHSEKTQQAGQECLGEQTLQ